MAEITIPSMTIKSTYMVMISPIKKSNVGYTLTKSNH